MSWSAQKKIYEILRQQKLEQHLFLVKLCDLAPELLFNFDKGIHDFYQSTHLNG